MATQDDKWEYIKQSFQQCHAENKEIIEALALIYNKVGRFEDEQK